MLSPIITTSSYGNRPCQLAICSAMSYCRFSPLPLSPMTANLRESGLFGNSRSCAGAAATALGARAASADVTVAGPAGATLAQQTIATSAQTGAHELRQRTRITLFSGNRTLDEVRNDVRVRIEQDQVRAEEPVFQLRRQLRQPREHARRDRRKRNLVGVPAVDDRLDVALLVLLEDLALHLRAAGSTKDVGQQLPGNLLHPRREDLAALRARAILFDQPAQRALMLIDLLRGGVLRQRRDRALEFLVERHVLVDVFHEFRNHRRVGVRRRLLADVGGRARDERG